MGTNAPFHQGDPSSILAGFGSSSGHFGIRQVTCLSFPHIGSDSVHALRGFVFKCLFLKAMLLLLIFIHGSFMGLKGNKESNSSEQFPFESNVICTRCAF